MGVGIFLSCLAMTVSGIVENVRRKKAIEQGLADDPHGAVQMSALWLVPQNCLTGLAEALFAIAQMEFYYSEFPKSMSSVAALLSTVGMGIGNLLASVVLSTVDKATKSGGKESWISNNINKRHYELYYWLLAAMTFANLVYFAALNVSGGASKKAKVQQSLKVKKEKLGDRITALHQLVSPFGKTDTAFVLSEAIGYIIRFLQGEIEALSSPCMRNASGSTWHHQHMFLNDMGMEGKATSQQDSQG